MAYDIQFSRVGSLLPLVRAAVVPIVMHLMEIEIIL